MYWRGDTSNLQGGPNVGIEHRIYLVWPTLYFTTRVRYHHKEGYKLLYPAERNKIIADNNPEINRQIFSYVTEMVTLVS